MRFSIPILAAALVGTVSGQDCEVPVVPGQYTGTPYPHSLEATEGAEVTFFKIQDPSGQYPCNSSTVRADLSLVNYMSLNTTGGRPLNDAIQRAIIIIHGLNRDAWRYEDHVLQALKLVTREGIDPDSVAVMAPRFSNGEDKNKAYPWNPDGEFTWQRAYSPGLVWYGSEWSGGAVNNYPSRTQTVSSFDVLDQLVQWFGDTGRFPNMKQIVIAGHSLGAQMVQRYTAVGKTASELGVDVPISYLIGDPNSFGWLAEDRPLSTSKCLDEYDDYREGFTNYSNYGADHTQPMTYGLDIVAAGREALAANYASRAINHVRGTRDHGDASHSCAQATTGKDRNERFFEYIKLWRPTCPNPAGKNCDTVDYVDTTHNAGYLLSSEAGLTRLFYDNWAGDGARAYGFGYPRQTAYDNPYADPARTGEALLNADRQTYAGGMRARGCWTDTDEAQTNPTMGQGALKYTGPLNTRTYCTNLCNDQGFRIAGVRANQCYCANQVTEEARSVAISSCLTRCVGDTSTICGGKMRLNLFAKGTVV